MEPQPLGPQFEAFCNGVMSLTLVQTTNINEEETKENRSDLRRISQQSSVETDPRCSSQAGRSSVPGLWEESRGSPPCSLPRETRRRENGVALFSLRAVSFCDPQNPPKAT